MFDFFRNLITGIVSIGVTVVTFIKKLFKKATDETESSSTSQYNDPQSRRNDTAVPQPQYQQYPNPQYVQPQPAPMPAPQPMPQPMQNPTPVVNPAARQAMQNQAYWYWQNHMYENSETTILKYFQRQREKQMMAQRHQMNQPRYNPYAYGYSTYGSPNITQPYVRKYPPKQYYYDAINNKLIELPWECYTDLINHPDRRWPQGKYVCEDNSESLRQINAYMENVRRQREQEASMKANNHSADNEVVPAFKRPDNYVGNVR